MAIVTEIDIAGTEGNMQAQPRVFAHDAVVLDLTVSEDAGGDPNVANELVYVVTGFGATPVKNDQIQVLSRGACLYIGGAGNVDVGMESGARVLFKGVTAGSFLPILATKIFLTDGASPIAKTTTATDIIALF
tara:strand:- start:530 stop:928 length:399 start_codon:yes stop_codon:yes gene_type:complete